MEIMQERQIWAVWTNTDLTEGRGIEFVKHYCETEATARRLARGGYVQGSDCRITAERMFYRDGAWYAPGPNVVRPTREDQLAEELLQEQRDREQRRQQAIERAKALGLSEEDLATLKG
jgi:hypothetical protein